MAIDDHVAQALVCMNHRQLPIFNAIVRERGRQEALKAEGKFLYTCADSHMLSSEKYLVLAEEVGEVARAVLNLHDFSRDYGADLGKVREELIQVAAVSVAWLEFIEGILSPDTGLRMLAANPPNEGVSSV